MKILGIRCCPTEYSYVVITGVKNNLKIKEKNAIPFPKSYKNEKLLEWFGDDIEEIIKNHKIEFVGIKGTEPMASRDKSFVTRVEYEAIVKYKAACLGVKVVEKYTNPTIAKKLTGKGKAKYLLTDLDYSSIPNFHKEKKHIQEAILVAWSMM